MQSKKFPRSLCALLTLCAFLAFHPFTASAVEPKSGPAQTTAELKAGSFVGPMKSEKDPEQQVRMTLVLKKQESGWDLTTTFSLGENGDYTLQPVAAKLEGNTLKMVVEYDWQGTPGKTTFDCQWDGHGWKGKFTTAIGEYRNAGTWEGSPKA